MKLKKIISLIITLCILMTSTVLVNAYSSNTKHYKKYDYTVKNGEATIVNYEGTEKVVKIPSKIKGVPVTAVDCYESFCVPLETAPFKLVIPKGINKIIQPNSSGRIRYFKVSKNNKKYSSRDGVLYNKKQTTLIAYKQYNHVKHGEETSFIVPKKVKKIAGGAFYEATNLKNVVLKKGVKEIGVCAFYGALNLKRINIPKSVTTIKKYAFKDCSSLNSMTIPSSVKKIGKMAVGTYSSGDDYEAGYLTSSFVIKGKKGTAAHKYAKAHGFKFKELK